MKMTVYDREEDRDLQKDRPAPGDRVDLLPGIKLHHRLLLGLLVVLVLLLDGLQLWLDDPHLGH